MTEQGWKDLIILATQESDTMNILIKLLCEQQEAKQILADAGYSWTGLSLIASVKEVLG